MDGHDVSVRPGGEGDNIAAPSKGRLDRSCLPTWENAPQGSERWRAYIRAVRAALGTVAWVPNRRRRFALGERGVFTEELQLSCTVSGIRLLQDQSSKQT